MMFQKEINSVAIHDLSHIIHMNFKLNKWNSSNCIFNFINILINKIYGCVAIYKDFTTIILNFNLVWLFLSNMIFNSFKKIKENLNNKIGGGKLSMFLSHY